MRRAKFLSSARIDLENILEYVARRSHSVSSGERFVERLRAKCRSLAALTATVGRPRPELRADLRSFPYEGYVIFFRYGEGRFEVVNILEGHRDVDAHYREP